MHGEMNTMFKEIKSIGCEFRNFSDNIKELKNMLENMKSAEYENRQTFEEEFDITLPFEAIEEFSIFNSQLATIPECCNRFVSHFLI